MRTGFDYNQLNDLLISVGLHLAILVLVVVTFPNTRYPVKPHLIFLGSFLSQQDMAFSLDEDSVYQRNVDARTINMDVRHNIDSHSVGKPERKETVVTSAKLQYKPIMAVDPPLQKHESQGNDGADEDFAPIAPVRMKLISDDKN